MLEKNGVQINLLIAGILDGLEYPEMLKTIDTDDGSKTENGTDNINE